MRRDHIARAWRKLINNKLNMKYRHDSSVTSIQYEPQIEIESLSQAPFIQIRPEMVRGVTELVTLSCFVSLKS